MRVVFVNLHTNGFYVRNIMSILLHKRSIKKRRYILDYLLENNIDILNLITPNGSGLPKKVRNLPSNYTFRKCEANYVLRKNGLPKEKIKNISRASEIRRNDIVIYYGFLCEQFVNVSDVHGIKIVDQIHFFGDKSKAEQIKDSGIQYYIYDVDLKKYSKLYQNNYNWFNGGYITLPLTYQERFCVKKNFDERKTKAVAIGTLTKATFYEFIETYGTEYYQPHRKMILDEAKKYSEELDSFISEWQEGTLKIDENKDSKFIKFCKRIFNYYQTGRQTSYFSFDMVDKYNEYKMFICPEDINGSYGIGTIEGMACGCAMIGWNYGAFEDMGMQAGVHYISYDGTMENLVDQIRFYQKSENQEKLKQIAKTGCEFVRSNFNERIVASNFYKKLLEISEGTRCTCDDFEIHEN